MSLEGQSNFQRFHGMTPSSNRNHKDGLNGSDSMNSGIIISWNTQSKISLVLTLSTKLRSTSTTEKSCNHGLSSKLITSTTSQLMDHAIPPLLNNAFTIPINYNHFTDTVDPIIVKWKPVLRMHLVKWTYKNLHQLNKKLLIDNLWTIPDMQQTTQEFQSRMHQKQSRKNFWTQPKTIRKDKM